MPFGVFASRIIGEELTSYVLDLERPCYDAGSYAASIDTLRYEGAAIEETDTSSEPPALSVEEVIPQQESYDPSREAIRGVLADKVSEVLSGDLSHRYVLAVKLYFGFFPDYPNPSFAEIGSILGVKAARAEEIFKRAMYRLRNSERMRSLIDFHGTEREGEITQPLRSGDVVRTARAVGPSTVRLAIEA